MRQVKFLESAAGVVFGYQKDEIVDVNTNNADFIESCVFGGLAEYTDEVVKKNIQPDRQPNENPDILPNIPARARGRKRDSPAE